MTPTGAVISGIGVIASRTRTDLSVTHRDETDDNPNRRGAQALLFQRGLGHAGLAFSIPIILYLFVTAIGTDYNILVTARLREEMRDGQSARKAAALAVEHAGPSVSGVPFFVEIGFAVTLGILLVALVVSLLLVPATTALLGRAAWWPGRRSQVPSALAVLDWGDRDGIEQRR